MSPKKRLLAPLLCLMGCQASSTASPADASGSPDRDVTALATDGGGSTDRGMTVPGPDGGDSTDRGMTVPSPEDAGAAAGACDPSFGHANACGGDLRGTWNVSKHCSHAPLGDVTRRLEAALATICPGARVREQQWDVTGTATYSTGLYTESLTTSGRVFWTLPGSCTEDCSVYIETARNELVLNAKIPNVIVFCPSGASQCNCELFFTDTATAAGSYSTASGRVAQNPAGGETRSLYYCVRNAELSLTDTSTNADKPVLVFEKAN